MAETIIHSGDAITARWRRGFVYACFVLTGGFGLVYEVVWSRYLALMIGNAAHASLAVLATYMGGLALGALLFGRFADRAKNCFTVYGWIEIGVGIYGALFPLLFPGMVRLTLPIGQALGPGTAVLTAFKILFAILCILLPTVLMGGTLPVLTRFLAHSPAGLRRSVSSLYAINSAGAVIGSLLAGFWLIVRLGLPGTMTMVGSINIALGLTVVLLSRCLVARGDEWIEPTGAGRPAQDAVEYGAAERRAAVLLAGFSGFAGMALEIAWIRYFTLVLGSSTYAFTIMLAAFITGITLGAFALASRAAGRIPLIPLMAGALFVSALFLGASLMVYDRLPYVFYRVQHILRPAADVSHLMKIVIGAGAASSSTAYSTPGAYRLYQAITYALCFVCMLLPTMATGLVFPAAVRLAARSRALGRGVGVVYGVNTVCALVGAAATALLLFHWIGLENIFRVLAALYAVAGGLLFLLPSQRGRRGWAVVAAVLLAVQLLTYRPLDARLLNQGLFRRHSDRAISFAELRENVERENLLFLGEGPHAMVTVRQRGGQSMVLTVNGKVDASTDLRGGDMYTQILIGQLPMLLHPDPRQAFVIGLGSGITAGSMLTHGGRVDVAEISPEVVEAEQYFRAVNGAPLGNPRLRLFVDDAKSVLRFLDQRYDVIVSEPTNPWIAGVAGLFSTEFFAQVKSRLLPGGVFAQWMHSYETTDEALSMVTATLLGSFAYVYVFEPINNDYIFVASDSPLAFDPAAFRARVAAPAVRADLARIHAGNAAVLLSTQIKTPARLRLDVPPGPTNSDLRPLLEYHAPLGVFLGSVTSFLANLDDRQHLEPGLLLSGYLRDWPLTPDDVRELMAYYQYYEPNMTKWSALLRLARQSLGENALETQGMFERLRKLRTWSFALDYWDNFALPPAATVVAVRERLEIGLDYFADRFHAWAPLEPAKLIAMIDWLTARGEDAKPYRLRLLAELCDKGFAAECGVQAARLAQDVGPTGPLPWRAEIVVDGFRLALRQWDADGAQKKLDELNSLGLQGDPNYAQMARQLAQMRAVLAFYQSR